MNPSPIVDINISNISQENFNYILIDITTAIINIHLNTGYLPEEIYESIYSKDGNAKILMLTT